MSFPRKIHHRQSPQAMEMTSKPVCNSTPEKSRYSDEIIFCCPSSRKLCSACLQRVRTTRYDMKDSRGGSGVHLRSYQELVVYPSCFLLEMEVSAMAIPILPRRSVSQMTAATSHDSCLPSRPVVPCKCHPNPLTRLSANYEHLASLQ